MFNFIINPLTNEKVSVFSVQGKQLLKRYVKEYTGGMEDENDETTVGPPPSNTTSGPPPSNTTTSGQFVSVSTAPTTVMSLPQPMTWKIEDGGNIHHNLAISSDAPLVTQDELLRRRTFPSKIVFVVQLMFYYKEHEKLSEVIAAIQKGYEGDIVYTFCLNGKKEKEKKRKRVLVHN